MDAAAPLGGLATICSVTSVVPQARKVIRTRDTGAISAGMDGVTVLGFALWLADGVLPGQVPLIVTNGVCLPLSAFILAMTLLPRRGRPAVADALDPSAGT